MDFVDVQIRGALRSGDNMHLLRAFLVDMTFRFRTVVDGRDAAGATLGLEGNVTQEQGHGVSATRYGLARAGHVSHLQVIF